MGRPVVVVGVEPELGSLQVLEMWPVVVVERTHGMVAFAVASPVVVEVVVVASPIGSATEAETFVVAAAGSAAVVAV